MGRRHRRLGGTGRRQELLAQALPGDVSSDSVFTDSTTDIDRILTQVRSYAT
ncbi:MAG: hypothetical protein M3319_01380 [Actinomycetota bacterium]|nr:hypothetical protein [Actinomycetota bacterium]